jgi:hypothetical protein
VSELIGSRNIIRETARDMMAHRVRVLGDGYEERHRQAFFKARWLRDHGLG